MTIRELYEWACKNNALDLPIDVQYRDDGGDYFGHEEVESPQILVDDDNKSRLFVLV